jgi:RNA polymerase primary sigma factor
LIDDDVLGKVKELFQFLDAREATVLKMRFGLEDTPTHTLKEIGEALGLTRERVRQIEVEALSKLQHGLSDPRERGWVR